MLPLDAAAFEMDADYRVNPTVLGQRPGILRFAGGRLSFTEQGQEVRFDAPMAEIHSPALAEMGSAVEIWHGEDRHRLVMSGGGSTRYWLPPATDSLLDVLLELDTMKAALAHFRNQKEAARSLLAFLQARCGPVPPGMRVRKPAGTLGYTLKAIAVVVVVTAAIVAVIWALYG